MKHKKPASISLDLDNQWSYMKIHGDQGWEDYPSYFDIFIPYILEILDELDLKITFFIVGKDADEEKNLPFLKMITEKGHEVGNHSYHHESWLQGYSRTELEKEIDNAHQAIEQATGKKPIGFRGPGFSWSLELLEVLKERNYIYDASTLPTYMGPIARKYYFWKSNLSKEEKKARSELYGRFKDGFRPLKPYFHHLKNNRQLLEIPVTTIPVFKIPFHLSYLLYLSGFSHFVMRLYLGFALLMCHITRTRPSFLIHPLDVIGRDQIDQLAFFPGMNISSGQKAEVFKYVITRLKKNYKLGFMSTHASHYLK
ncbi:MAG: polysaccharide deacetylase family protein [Bacteroidetes bacterium]|nr:polysaccharide deacetylase family protein [Bacteroidota bacterium]MBL6963743.1 polysaccharide deacetylase family protein [Bacteroidota bacterium]